jgi:hypothetical protein
MLGRVVTPIVDIIDIDGIVQRIDVNELVERIDWDRFLGTNANCKNCIVMFVISME